MSDYTSTYRIAMEAAQVELDSLFEDAKRLRNRMEQIDSAILALKPLVGSAGETPGAHFDEQGVTSVKQQFDAVLGMAFA